MTISKERRDEIRAAAEKATPGPWEVGPVDDTVVTNLGADGLRYEVAGIDGDYNSPDEWPTMEANAAHIANCDPQTILALLDALDAAEKAEPVAWMYPDGRAGHAVTMDRKVACDAFPGIANPAPHYTHPAPAVREGWVAVPVEPTEEMIIEGHKQIDWCRNGQNTHRPGHPSQKPEGVGTDCGDDIRDAWAAMLAAAPEAK